MIFIDYELFFSIELKSSDHEVFPYSVFYVFYEQYITAWRDTATSLGISFGVIFVISFILTGFNIMSAIVILLTIFMIVTDLVGLMYFWNISLNAVSLVNLVMVRHLTVHCMRVHSTNPSFKLNIIYVYFSVGWDCDRILHPYYPSLYRF